MSLSMSLEGRDDDLPRTLRRKSMRTEGDDLSPPAPLDAGHAPPAVVTDIRIPFWRLVLFCFKLALAAMPAIVMLAVVLHLLTALATSVLPDFRIWKNNLEYGARSTQPVSPPPAQKPR
jgi:hypothetical protein